MTPDPPVRSRSQRNLLKVLFDISSLFSTVAPFSILKCIRPCKNLVSTVYHSLLSNESVAMVTESLSPACFHDNCKSPSVFSEYCNESPEIPPVCWIRDPGEQVLKLKAMCPRGLRTADGNVTCEFNDALKNALWCGGVEVSSLANSDGTSSAKVDTVNRK